MNDYSGDENMDMSPSNALLLTKSPPRFSSTLSLDNTDASSKPLNPLAPLFDTPHQVTTLLELFEILELFASFA